MARILRETMLQIRELSLTWGPFVLIGIAALVGSYLLLDPQPPRHVTIAIGGGNSAYEVFAKRYAAELRRYGIQVALKTTSGSCENLKLLHDKKAVVDFAFILGGSCDSAR